MSTTHLNTTNNNSNSNEGSLYLITTHFGNSLSSESRVPCPSSVLYSRNEMEAVSNLIRSIFALPSAKLLVDKVPVKRESPHQEPLDVINSATIEGTDIRIRQCKVDKQESETGFYFEVSGGSKTLSGTLGGCQVYVTPNPIGKIIERGVQLPLSTLKKFPKFLKLNGISSFDQRFSRED